MKNRGNVSSFDTVKSYRGGAVVFSEEEIAPVKSKAKGGKKGGFAALVDSDDDDDDDESDTPPARGKASKVEGEQHGCSSYWIIYRK